MKKSTISIEEFKKYMARVNCVNLLHYKIINIQKLKEVSMIEKIEFDDIQDVATFKDDKIVWYVNDKNERVQWNENNARNVTIEEQVMFYKQDNMPEDIKTCLSNIKSGQNRTIEIVTIFDTILNQRVIVEGVQRAVALYFLYLDEKETLRNILESSLKVFNIIFSSPAGSLLFPCDFVNICRDYEK